jgi:cytochrome c oxidase subunit II
MRRRSLLILAAAMIAATAAGIVLSYVIKWFPVAASTQAHETDTLYHVLVIASIPIFVLVVGAILYAVWQFRMRPGQEMEDGAPIHGHTGLEVFWTAVPAALVIGLVSYSFVVLHANEKKPASRPQIEVGVTARQFEWSFEYPPALTGGKPVSSYQLYLPVGDSVLFKIHALDVIHGFWVPAFREQIDAVPGITTTLRANTDRAGTYPLVCSVLCGPGHSLMRTSVHVLQPGAFRSWLASQAAGGAGASTGSAAPAPAPSQPAGSAPVGEGAG